MQLAFILPILSVILAVAADPYQQYSRVVHIVKSGIPSSACLRAHENFGDAPVYTTNVCNIEDPNTLWTVVPTGDANGSFYLKIFGDKCTSTNPPYADLDGAQLVIRPCDDANMGAFPLWQENTDHTINWLDHNKCIDNTDGMVGKVSQIWTCTPSNPNQTWYMIKVSD
ncbi:hypothetical protein CPB86DRAFT_800726 [Serendipita vermifera]|nr:hypothetical protein CPB86DRAFT_800726 [Serendipita vermifera]